MSNAIISKTKLEELRGMGLIDEDKFDEYQKNLFESNRNNTKELMVNIGPHLDVEIGKTDTRRCTISVETVKQLKGLGLIKMDKINSKEITFSDFESQYENKQKLIVFSVSKAEDLDALLTAGATKTEVSNDGTVDLDAPAAEAGEDAF